MPTAPGVRTEAQQGGKTVTVFEDRNGVKRTQVNGVWADDPASVPRTAGGHPVKAPLPVGDTTSKSDAKESTMHKAMDTVEHAAEGVMHSLGSFADSWFHKKKDPEEEDKETKLRKALDTADLGDFLGPLQKHGIDS